MNSTYGTYHFKTKKNDNGKEITSDKISLLCSKTTSIFTYTSYCGGITLVTTLEKKKETHL